MPTNYLSEKQIVLLKMLTKSRRKNKIQQFHHQNNLQQLIKQEAIHQLKLKLNQLIQLWFLFLKQSWLPVFHWTLSLQMKAQACSIWLFFSWCSQQLASLVSRNLKRDVPNILLQTTVRKKKPEPCVTKDGITAINKLMLKYFSHFLCFIPLCTSCCF